MDDKIANRNILFLLVSLSQPDPGHVDQIDRERDFLNTPVSEANLAPSPYNCPQHVYSFHLQYSVLQFAIHSLFLTIFSIA